MAAFFGTESPALIFRKHSSDIIMWAYEKECFG